MRLQGQIIDVADLKPATTRAMLTLMRRYYANVDKDVFLRDLAEKDWIIELRNRSGQLCGFSTQMMLRVATSDGPVSALFSGDTIIDQAHWGDQMLTHLWGRLALSLIDRHANSPLYWFLISQGYKTYRFLPVFFHAFYPRCDVSTPRTVQATLDALARHKFPEHYEPAAGIIRSSSAQYYLRSGVAPPTPQRLTDPHVRYFVTRNPRHAVGDELCCLAPLTRENFTPAAYRVIGEEAAQLNVA